MVHRHSLTRYTVLLAVTGLIVNLALSRLALHFDLPLYLDSVGTVLAAILGGALPGIVAGFFANAINGLSDPITFFYSIISVLIGVFAADFAKKGYFAGFRTALLPVLLFVLIGGGVGSVLTWLLNGYSIGTGISAQLATAFYKSGLTPFLAQLSADLLFDLADKLITVLLCIITVRLLPVSFLKKLPNGQLYLKKREPELPSLSFGEVRHSLRGKIVLLISISALIISSASTTIGFVLYRNTMNEHYSSIADSVTEMELTTLDADRVKRYIDNKAIDFDYITDELNLKRLLENVPDIEYIYVYQILEDGCHVVFDIDTPDVKGGEFGDVIDLEPAYEKYFDTLLSGGEIPVVISKGAYGWLLSSYKPLVDSTGSTVAYVGADIKMDTVMTDRTIFVIKMAALLFGVSIIIVAFALWFAERQLVDPINAMADAADKFAYDSDINRHRTTAAVQNLNISTGDEIEKLYGSLRKTVTDVSAYIEDINSKAEIISRLHQNIIISFATMVENRDDNTGHHIRRTAAYVNIIASQLHSDGVYPDIINDEYIATVVRCAPLHDLGKIKVPDAILNKPGRLTPEEFELMKTHTTAGKEIIDGIVSNNSGDADYLSEAANMAFCHHERWDGKGYPSGLRGEEIPLSARIMAVADVFDALISKRSYKEAMSVDEAYKIILSESGTHFDPTVVEAFLRARVTTNDVK